MMDSLFDEVFEELGTLSIDDLTDMISGDGHGGGASENGPASVDPAVPTEYGKEQPERASFRDVYRAGDRAPEHQSIPKEVEGNGLVKDEITLKLLKRGVVSMDHVSLAIERRTDGEPLWRAVAERSDLDPDTVLAAVADLYGMPRYDSEPDDSWIPVAVELTDLASSTDVLRWIHAGLMPVDIECDADGRNLKVTFVSGDPMAPRTQEALLSAPGETTCFYVPGAALEPIRDRALSLIRERVKESGSVPEYLSFDIAEDDDPPSTAYGESAQSAGRPDATPDNTPDRDEQDLIDAIFERFGHDRVIKSLIVNTDVSAFKIQEAIHALQARGTDEALWRVLAETKGVDRETIFREAASVYAFKHEKVEPGRPDFDFVELMMKTVGEEQRDEMIRMRLLPFEHTLDMETGSGRIVFVTHDPSRPEVSKLLHSLDVGRFELRYAPEPSIKQLLDQLFPQKNEYLERMTESPHAFDLGTSYEEEQTDVDEDALEAEINRSKLLNLFEASLIEAVRQGVSDVHIFPNPRRQVEIHFRVDGRLKRWHVEDKVNPEAFLAVVKDNAMNVDRFERDAAQDGYIQRTVDGTLIRFRVSTLPIASANAELRAESVVIRILDDRKVLTDITKLGMLDSTLERFEKAIRLPHGMVVVTGPTGSGKSTTLVAALHRVLDPELNVLTVEDPVEYIIPGVRQIKLNHKLGHEGALRAILRHDPDIVMVGEMRDRQTAELAIKLANTGHLTFSTLHTNDAPSAIARLYKMGIEPFLLAYAINMVVAQRLIREICSKCRTVDDQVDEVMLRSMGFSDREIEETTFYAAGSDRSCKQCSGRGFKGRRAICETLYFSREIRNIIAESGEDIDEDRILKQALKEGMLTLQDSARELVKMGVTTADEMLRVTATA